MGCAIWYHLHNLKNVKKSHGGVLLLGKLQAYNFTKSNTPPWVFFTFFKLYKWYQIAQNITVKFYFDPQLQIFLLEDLLFWLQQIFNFSESPKADVAYDQNSSL